MWLSGLAKSAGGLDGPSQMWLSGPAESDGGLDRSSQLHGGVWTGENIWGPEPVKSAAWDLDRPSQPGPAVQARADGTVGAGGSATKSVLLIIKAGLVKKISLFYFFCYCCEVIIQSNELVGQTRNHLDLGFN